MATYKAVVLKGTNDKKSDGTTNIKIRITKGKSTNYLATDMFVFPSYMDNKAGAVRLGTSKDFINTRIAGLLKTYREKDMELGDQRDYMTVSEIKQHLLSGKSKAKEIDFFEFTGEYIKTVTVKGTLDQYKALVASLKIFNGEKLPVTEITVNFLMRYEMYLRSRKVGNGIINYMRTFRALFNKCRDHFNDEDSGRLLVNHYPFKKYTFPKRTTDARDHVLTLAELRLLINYQPENPGEVFSKYMFLLMIYLIGIEAKDLFYLGKLQKGRIVYNRFKTNRAHSIFIEPEALEIIERYKGNQFLMNISERFEHHKSFYRAVNNYLTGEKSHNIKGMLPKLGIRKKVTTKWARHTWATIARNDCRINKDDVALCLGHEDIDNQVTDMYVKYDYSIIDEANRKVIDMIFEIMSDTVSPSV
jgi:integrase